MSRHLIDYMRRLVRKIDSVSDLSVDEKRVLEDLPAMTRNYRSGQDVVRQGDRPNACALISAGWACRYKMTGTGRRQILSFHVAGDIPDLQSLLLTTMDHSLAALTDLEVAFVPHDRLRDVSSAHPRLGRALWRDTLVDASIYREWMLAMGRLSATEHMSHLFCELYSRLEAVGLLSSEYEYVLPISQGELADALGMSPVHINRTLQELRGLGLISWTQGKLKIHDWEGLKGLSEYDPGYLHLVA